MEDNDIRDLFRDFSPATSSDADFMTRLRRNMEAVELVREHTMNIRRRSRRAVVAAALSGFVAGVVLTLAFPYILQMIRRIAGSIPGIAGEIADTSSEVATFILSAGAIVGIVIGMYNLVSSSRPRPSSACA